MWGREIEPHTVLYLSLEDTFNRLQKRLLQLVGGEEAPEHLVMQTEFCNDRLSTAAERERPAQDSIP